MVVPPGPSPDTGFDSGGSLGITGVPRNSAEQAPFNFNQTDPYGLLGDGFNGPEQLAYPQMWANMFGIKVDTGDLADLDNPFENVNVGRNEGVNIR